MVWSLSARRAWIEIRIARRQSSVTSVALRKESVDRNRVAGDCATAETASLSARRAWIEIIDYIIDYATNASLSARRAWIEILGSRLYDMSAAWNVALRKESVDRNIILPKQLNRPAPSLSARRAWIEMPTLC